MEIIVAVGVKLSDWTLAWSSESLCSTTWCALIPAAQRLWQLRKASQLSRDSDVPWALLAVPMNHCDQKYVQLVPLKCREAPLAQWLDRSTVGRAIRDRFLGGERIFLTKTALARFPQAISFHTMPECGAKAFTLFCSTNVGSPASVSAAGRLRFKKTARTCARKTPINVPNLRFLVVENFRHDESR